MEMEALDTLFSGWPTFTKGEDTWADGVSHQRHLYSMGRCEASIFPTIFQSYPRPSKKMIRRAI